MLLRYYHRQQRMRGETERIETVGIGTASTTPACLLWWIIRFLSRNQTIYDLISNCLNDSCRWASGME